MTDIADIRSRMHGLTEQECPELTPRQQLAEARRRALKRNQQYSTGAIQRHR